MIYLHKAILRAVLASLHPEPGLHQAERLIIFLNIQETLIVF